MRGEETAESQRSNSGFLEAIREIKDNFLDHSVTTSELNKLMCI
jgi:hypothetical protein